MSLLSEMERGTATGGAFDSPAFKPGTLYQPALQAGLKCDDSGQKRMRFPEVPFGTLLVAMDKCRDLGLSSALAKRFGRLS